MKMMNFAVVNIPSWLFGSDFYSNLDGTEQDSTIQIPTSAYRLTCEGINSCEDLASVIEVMRFWGVRSVPRSVLCYCYENGSIAWRVLLSDYLGLHGSIIDSLNICVFPGRVPMLVVACIGRSEIVDFWFEKNRPDDESKEAREAIAHASGLDRLDLVQALHERGFPWDRDAPGFAAYGGLLHILKYLHEHGCPLNSTAPSKAALCGHLDCLKYLHEHGCDWNASTTLGAAVGGHRDCLRYALEQSCPCHQKHMLQAAAESDNDTCLKYLCEVQDWDILADKTLLQYAFNKARLPNVMYLTEKGALHSFYYLNKREYYVREDAGYDADLLACIQYAVSQGWKYNINLYNFIFQRSGEKDAKMRLPLCKAYVQAEKWKLIVDQQMAQYASNK